MSEQVIDERVVSMKFDNEEFEKKSAQSLSTIQKLKQALNFKDAVKSLDNLEKASKSMDLSHISNSVDAIKEKFNGWEVAARAAITNVTNSAVNAAKRIVESVTIDPVRTGLGVYEQKLNSVQTMLNNSGESLEKVSGVLEDLNTYSDKTIFSLNDMTTALGKFTAQGVDLETAARIIKGAANEAASMGAGSAEFSRFIYNLTQAYGMGKMTTIDWKSLENAGVAGREFKEELIAAAKAVGTLDDKGMYKGQLVTTANLREFLKDGIITAKVMTKTFEKYANEQTALGQKASAAAKQIKTFHQLLDVLAESVASTWSQSFGYIIGDFYEARRLWTNVSKIFEQTVGKMNENRNKLLKAWHDGFIDPAETSLERIKELEQAQRSGAYVGTKDLDARISGRTLLFDGLANVLNAVLRAITPVKEAFREVFPATTARNLWEATKNFRDFTAHLKLSDGALKEIKDAARGLFEILKFGRTFIKDVIGALIPATKEVDSLAVIILKIAGFLGRTVTKVIESIRASEGYSNALQGITYYAGLAIKIVGTLIGWMFKIGKAAHEAGVLQKVLGAIGTTIEVIVNLLARLAPAAVVVFRTVGIAVAGVLALIGRGLEVVEGFFGNLFGKKSEGNESGANIVAGITKGVENNVGEADKAMDSLAKGMINTFAKDIDSHSPSLVFAAFGAMIVAGLVVGIAKAAGVLSQSENQILQFIGRIGQGVSDTASKIKYYLVEARDDSSAIVTHMQSATETVGESSKGLINNIARGMRTISGFIKNLNWGAVVVVGILGVLLYNVTRIIMTVYSVGDALRNGMKSLKNMTSGFSKMATAFKRMHSPLVETLKGIAICVMGIAASLWLLSTLRDTGNLAPVVFWLLASFTAIMLVASAAAKFVNDNELTDDIKNLAIMVLMMAGSFMIMGLAFTDIINVLQDINNDADLIFSALGIIGVLGAGLFALNYGFSKFSNSGSIKAMATVLIWSLSLKRVMSSLGDLMTASKGMKGPEIEAMLYEVGAVLVLMLALGILGLAFKDTGFGSAVTVIAMILGIKAIINAIKEINWDEAVPYINAMHNTIVIIVMSLAVIAAVLALAGPGLKDFGTGLLYIVGAIAGMILVCKAIQKLELSDTAISQAIRIATAVGILAAALIVAMHFFDVPVGKFTGFSIMLLALDTVMIAMAKTVSIVNASGDFNQGKDTFTRVALCMSGLVFCLAILAGAMYFTKDAQVGKFAKIIFGVAGIVLALAVLAKAAVNLDGGQLIAIIGSLVVIFGGLFFLIAALTHLDGDVNTKALRTMITGIVLIIAGLAILSLIPTNKLVPALISLTVVMFAFAGLIMSMEKIKGVDTGPIITAVVGIGIITASLIILTYYDWDKLFISMGVMVATMMSFALVVKSMENINADAIGPMLVAVIAVLAVAASLGFLAMMNWPGIMEAALSMSLTLLAVAAALTIVSNGTNGAGNILASALAIAVVAGSIILIAHAMQVLNGVPFDYVFMAAIALGTIALALKVLASEAIGAVIASAAIIAVAAALVLIGAALNMFTLVSGGDVFSAIAVIAVLTVVLYALSTVAPMAILASAALVITAAALVILGAALMIIGKAEAGAGTLALIALSLMLMGVAGTVLALGASGLILGGIGLIAIGGGLIVIGKADKSVTGTRLAGLAGGLMMMGLAGVVLSIGAAGLIAGGIGLNIVALGLLTMSKVSIKGRALEALGEGLLPFAIAGVVGTIAGPGLIALSIGLMAITGAIAAMAKIVSLILGIDLIKMGEDATTAGEMVVEGANQGILGGLGKLGKTVLNLGKGIIDTFAKVLGIHSPSEVFKWLGQKILQGLGLGVGDTTLNSGLGDVMKGVADNLLGSFTGEFGGGLEKITNMLGGFTKKATKKVYKKVAEHGGAGGGAMWAWVDEVVEENPFGDLMDSLGLGNLAEEFKSMFSEDTFGGVNDLASMFDDWDFSIEDVTNSMGGLNLQMDNVDLSNTELTKNMAKSVDVFADYDRQLTTTTADIKKNMIENMIGEQEWQDRLNNLIAVGFDPKLVQEIMDKGKNEGSKIAAALLAEAIPNPDFVKEYNADFLKTQAIANSTNTVFSKVLEEMIETGKTANEYGITFKKTVETINGTYSEANPAYSAANIADQMEDANNEAQRALLAQSKLYENAEERRKSYEERLKKATQEEDAGIVDAMLTDLSESIKQSINKYMPSTEFVGIGTNICLGIASGIFGGMTLTTEAVELSAIEMVEAFQKALDINSPSKVFYGFGEFIQEGLARGISDDNAAVNSTKEMGENLLSQFRSVLNDILAIMETDETWQPTIRPVVDFTNIQTGAYEAQSAFNGISIGARVNAVATDIQASKAANSAPTLAGMSREEFRDFLTGFAETIVEGITSNDGSPVEVNVTLEGDAKGLFNVVREQNTEYKKTSGGRSALA